RWRSPQGSISRADERTAAAPAGSAASTAGRSGRPTTATSTATTTTTGADRHAPDVAFAHGGVPGGLDLAGVVEVDAAVDDDEGIGNTVDRAVQIVEDRSLIAPVAVIVVAPLVFHRREIHRLGVDEFRALHAVVGAHAEARIQQIRDRSRLSRGVVLEIREGDIVQLMTEVVELV